MGRHSWAPRRDEQARFPPCLAYSTVKVPFIPPCSWPGTEQYISYDPAREGVVVQGVAQRPLPRIALEVDGEDIVATGMSGLIFGFRSNLASATQAG
jgi:hypothetical protein